MIRTIATRIDDRWAWADRASCQGLEDMFYNEEYDPKRVRREKERQAKKICAGCPVIDRCRDHAMTARELYGVWGGLAEMDCHALAGRDRTG